MTRVVNSSYEEIEVGQTVDRLDNYKRDGQVLVVNSEHRPPVLVRWASNQKRSGEEWCKPDLLFPRPSSLQRDTSDTNG